MNFPRLGKTVLKLNELKVNAQNISLIFNMLTRGTGLVFNEMS